MWCKEAQTRDGERGLACINDPAGAQEVAAHADRHMKVTERGS